MGKSYRVISLRILFLKFTEISSGESSTSSQNETRPTTVMEETEEGVMASGNSTEETATTEDVMGVQNSTEKPKTMQNTTDASLKNVTASTNATNTTEVEEYDGPSSILYPRKFVFKSCRILFRLKFE